MCFAVLCLVRMLVSELARFLFRAECFVGKFVRFPVRNPVRNRSEKHGLLVFSLPLSMGCWSVCEVSCEDHQHGCCCCLFGVNLGLVRNLTAANSEAGLAGLPL